jgi:hypothetical protein
MLPNKEGKYAFRISPNFPVPQITLTFLKKGYQTLLQNFSIYETNQLTDVALKPQADQPNVVDTSKTRPAPIVSTTPSVSTTNDTINKIVNTNQQQPETILAPATVFVPSNTKANTQKTIS